MYFREDLIPTTLNSVSDLICSRNGKMLPSFSVVPYPTATEREIKGVKPFHLKLSIYYSFSTWSANLNLSKHAFSFRPHPCTESTKTLFQVLTVLLHASPKPLSHVIAFYMQPFHNFPQHFSSELTFVCSISPWYHRGSDILI